MIQPGKYEQMAIDAEKDRSINEGKYSLEEQMKSFNEFIESCKRVSDILRDDELYKKECDDWMNKTGRYVGK